MRLKRLLRAAVAVAALAPSLLGLQVVLGSAASADAIPAVTSVSPNSGPQAGGTVVELDGTGFTGAYLVRFNGSSVPFTLVSDQEITATTPPGTGVASIVVYTPAGVSSDTSQDQFLYKPGPSQPAITELFPSTGTTAGGTAVTMTGQGFTDTTSVTFGGVAALNFTVVTDNEITMTAPAGSAGPVPITVTTPGGTASSTDSDNTYVYADTPVVTGISPDFGPSTGGASVTITGSNFTGTTGVTFRTIPATSFTVENDTTIVATAPPWTDGTIDVTVTNPAGTSANVAADQYTYTSAAPVVTAVSPATGPDGGGTQVTITGTGLFDATGVSFGSVPATSVGLTSPTTVTAVVPPGTGVVDVTVTSPDGTSATSPADQFSYGAAPTATVLFPGLGGTAGGTQVTVSGTGFVAGQTSVTVDGTVIPPASVTVQNSSVLTFVTPPHAAGTASVTVTAPGGTSDPVPGGFSYRPPPPPPVIPVVTAVSPSSGSTAGGTTVTITGTGFVIVTGVWFGSVEATTFGATSATSITAVAPPGTAGPVDVRVASKISNVSAVTAADHFTYQVPGPVCTTTITGTHSAVLTVSSGLTCLVGAKQNGSVTVAAGASLSVTNSAITGTVTATSPGAVTYCGSTENGKLSVSGATGPVTLGNGGSCAADTIPSAISITGSSGPVTVTGLKVNGTLTLSGDTGGVALARSSVTGSVYVQGNAGPSVLVSADTVQGSLSCAGNNPAPTAGFTLNTVSGTAAGQCAALVRR